MVGLRQACEEAASDSEDIKPDTMLRLAIAARVAFPDRSMSVAALRREGAAKRLRVYRIAGKDFTTLADIQNMKEAAASCQEQAKAPISTCGKPSDPVAFGDGLSSTESSGKRIEQSTGAFEGDRAAAEKFFAEYLAGKHVPNFGRGHPAEVLIVDVLAYYGEHKVPNAAREGFKLAATLSNLGTFFADKTVDDITPQLCEDYVKWRIGQGDIRFTLDATKRGRALKPTTARNDLIVLQAAQNYCFANRKLTHVVEDHQAAAIVATTAHVVER